MKNRRTIMRRSDRAVCAALALTLLAGCSEDAPTGPATGVLEVTVITTGEDIDADGYLVSVDAAGGESVGANGTVSIAGLAGVVNVGLSGIAENCTVEGSSVRPVTVAGAAVARLTFRINCHTLLGALSISTTSSGDDMDPDGYTVYISGTPGEANETYGIVEGIGINGTLTIPALQPGNYEVFVYEVAPNCDVEGSGLQKASVASGNTTVVAFEVVCETLVLPGPTGTIVFQSDRDGNINVYAMYADGSSQTQVTSNQGFDGVPAISPDRTKILFETTRTGDSEIYVTDGTTETNLTNHAAWDERPSWSPDGSRILFVSDRDGAPDIFVMNADGSGAVNLTQSSAIDRPAAWSPNGEKIVFSSNRTGSFEIFVLDADGSNPVQLTDTPSSADFAPAWSPDGSRIAFISNPEPGNPSLGDIHVMNANGSGRVNLTNSFELNNRWPSWSPDGNFIVFGTQRTGDFEVFVMKADGSAATNVSNSPQSNDIPGWPQAWTR
jgi:Tol biopolymer transport system component